MELVLEGVLGLGYALQNNSKTKQTDVDVKNNEIPSVNNIYNSNYSLEARSQEMKKVDKNFEMSKKPVETNIIPRNFNKSILK